ncbi:hypothetical protein [Methanospirillum purgamenti]|nr:hypothetical protein [Methanospirillum hungatei]
MDQSDRINLIRRQILHESILYYEKKISDLEKEVRIITVTQNNVT